MKSLCLILLSIACVSFAENRHVKYKGLKGVAVAVGDLKEAVLRSGLSEHSLKTLTENRLKKSKVPILSLHDNPHLYVNIHTLQMKNEKKTFVYHISVKLSEPSVSLPRNKEWLVPVTTWNIGMTGFCSPKKLKSEVEAAVIEMVGDFTKVYLKANPPATAKK